MAECGKCELCCKLLGVHELEKPMAKWCQHSTKGHGCAIYAERPPSCRAFSCGWFAADGAADRRPDKVHMVFAGFSARLNAYIVHIDPAYPLAHLRPKAQHMLNALRTRRADGRRRGILFYCGDRSWLVDDGPHRAMPASALTIK